MAGTILRVGNGRLSEVLMGQSQVRYTLLALLRSHILNDIGIVDF